MQPATPPPYPSTLLQNSWQRDEPDIVLLLDAADFLSFDEEPEEHHAMAAAHQAQPDELLLQANGDRGNRTKQGYFLDLIH